MASVQVFRVVGLLLAGERNSAPARKTRGSPRGRPHTSPKNCLVTDVLGRFRAWGGISDFSETKRKTKNVLDSIMTVLVTHGPRLGGGGPTHLSALLQLLAPSYSLFARDERTRGAGNGGGAPWPPPMPPSASPSPSLPTRGHLSLHGCDRSLVTKLAMIGGFFGGLGNLRGSFPNKEPPTHPPKSVVRAVGEYGEEYSGAPMLLQRL